MAVGPLLFAILALFPTPPPDGPYRISGPDLLDAHGRPVLLRGTTLPPTAWTATALITIRQRLNMNAVRIPKATPEIVRLANRLELLAIVEDDAAPPEIRDNPNVILAVTTPEAAPARPFIARGFRSTSPHAIHEFSSWDAPDIPGPLLANDLDPRLDEPSPECAAFPSDPGAAERFVRGKLRAFDDRRVHWTLSSFAPGRLITDYRYFVGTKLDDGWTCGVPSAAGLGLTLLGHLWNADPHGLFAVHGDGGGYLLPIGGRATVYGPTLADAEHYAPPKLLPTRLGNLSVRITDSRGVSRLAPLLYAAAGWAHINFVVPETLAPGPAEIAVIRSDGSRAVTRTMLLRAAPAFASASYDGRGVAKAWDGASPTFTCAADCAPVPIRPGAHIRFEGTGFRRAKKLRVLLSDNEARIVAFGPLADVPGKDVVTIEIPKVAPGVHDVVMWADGVLSNVVLIQTMAPGLPPNAHGPTPRRTAVHLAPPR